MEISNNGKDLIKKYEGLSLEAYYCPSNVLTIGYGHTKNVYLGQKITEEEANILFDNDIKNYEKYVQKYSNLNQNQYDSLVSFTYNCGPGALDDVMTSGDITGTMKLYHHGNDGIDLSGLIKRRNEEIELYNKPIENNEYIISEYPESATFYPNCTINFRNKPLISENNPIIDTYSNTESVNYDKVVITNKYVYISWISESEKTRRYMPVREVINGSYQKLWGYIK